MSFESSFLPKLFDNSMILYEVWPLVLNLLSQTRFALQDLVTAQYSQDSLIHASLKLPHQTSAQAAEIEAVFADYISR